MSAQPQLVGFVGEEELIYPISLNYGNKDWTIISALREFLSNMLDTKTVFSIDYQKGMAVIADQGDGLTKKSFIFGESTRDDSQIGQFGEGLKMAFITLLRHNRQVFVETAGFNVNVERVESKDFGTTIMKLRFIPNQKTSGTVIYAECTEAELNEARTLFLQLTELEKVDQNVYLPEGNIFVLGLKTTTLPNMLFSYDLPDKRLTNRDRNIVETAKLQENIVAILRMAKNQRLIKAYLSAFQTNPSAYEYQLSFLPMENRLDLWKKVLDKLYPKAVLSSDVKSDLYATMMGYTVLRNTPYHVLMILRKLGLVESSIPARDYQGEVLQEKNKIIFPVSEDYVANWSRKDAIKELIANALDAGDQVRILHNGKEARISDNGEGILKKHFLLGVSEKDETTIGQFGEGMKMGFLVLARTNSPVRIETVGFTYQADLEYSDEFGLRLLTISYTKNMRTKGTSFVFTCTEQELEDAKQMFAQFQGRRKRVESDQMDVYLDQPGVIYSNGLETARLDTIFSYNVKDKKMVITRDRNAVDVMQLSNLIQQFMSKTEEEEIVLRYLTEWEKKQTSIEYRVEFNPINNTVWSKLVKKAYAPSSTCFAVDGYEYEDFIAKQAGFKLLRNVPYGVRSILERYGVKRADQIAKKYKDNGILLGDRLVYPITKEYAKNWSVIDAVKELIANSLDTASSVSINEKDGIISISDKGEGLSKKHLLFGSSTKGEDQIGMFGEGLKMASLVLARQQRDLRVATKGFEYQATIEHDKQFNADVLVIHLKKSKKRIGTDITLKGSETELTQAKSYFLQFNKEIKSLCYQVYSPGGNVFVNGVFVQNLNSLFSYNLINAKELLSRDRKSIDIEKAKIFFSTTISMIDNKNAIEMLLKNTGRHSFLEYSLPIHLLSSESKTLWKSVAEKVFGKACFATGTDYDGVARDKGYKLLMDLPANITELLSSLGFLPASKVVKLRGDENVVQERFDIDELSGSGKKRWERAKSLFAKLYNVRYANRIELVEKFKSDVVTDSVWGLYNPINDVIYILSELVNDTKKYSFETLMGVMIHEQTHRMSGAYDRTREFEFALTSELGRIATLYDLSCTKE